MQPNQGRSLVWRCLHGRLLYSLLLATGLTVLFVGSPALAAEVRSGEGENGIFRLPAGEVIQDDLYVTGGEIYIEGNVEGDLVAFGGYIEVNGNVTGDVIAAGGGVVINGAVGDDARIGGGGVTVAGTIGDDLFMAGGGQAWPGGVSVPIRINGRNIPQGVTLANSGRVGGDAYIAGGSGAINGEIDGNLFSGMGSVSFGGRVGGDANLYAGAVTVQDNAAVSGVLRYRSEQPAAIPSGVAATIEQEQPATADIPSPRPNVVWSLLSWLWRTLLLALGFALAAWLIWQLAPGMIRTCGEGVRTRPVEAGLYGIVVAALILPVLAALVIIAGIFWGIAAAAATAFFLLGAVGLLWILSPLFAGYWLGGLLSERGYVQGPLLALVVGALVIVLAARLFSLIPCVGAVVAGLIYLLSFVLAIGGLIVARRMKTGTPPPALAATG